MPMAHSVKELKVENDCDGTVERTIGGRPRPPVTAPSARRNASAWRMGPRDVPNSLQSAASLGNCEPGGQVPSVMRRMNSSLRRTWRGAFCWILTS